MRATGRGLLLLGTVLGVACGQVQDDASCPDSHCPAQGIGGEPKASAGGGADSGGASFGDAGAGGAAGGADDASGSAGTSNGADAGSSGTAGDAGSAGAVATESAHWGSAQSASHEQMDDALANGAQQLAVAGDDSAFTIWKSNAPGFPVYVSRYTPDGAWSEPYPLDPESGDRNAVLIAAEHDGDAIAAWLRVTAAGSEIRAARYHAGWQPSAVISALTVAVDPGLQIVSNPNGDYFVAWAQASTPAGTTRKQIAHYLHDQGWQPLFAPSCTLEADPSTAVPFGPIAASINPKGDALFSWFDSGLLFGSYLFAQRYLADGGFQACETAAQKLNGQSLTHAQALDDAGRGFLVWNQGSDNYEPPTGQIYASTFDGTWSAPVHVSDYGEGPVLAASDAAGHLIVVWPERRFIGTVMASTSLLGGPWSIGQLDAGAFMAVASAPVLSMSRSGTALIAWQQLAFSASSQAPDMFASSWRFETGFAKPTLISEGQLRDYVSVVSDPSDNGMLLWRSGRTAGMPLLQAARYSPEAGWQTPPLDVASEGGDLPILAAGESGEVVAAWYGAYP